MVTVSECECVDSLTLLKYNNLGNGWQHSQPFDVYVIGDGTQLTSSPASSNILIRCLCLCVYLLRHHPPQHLKKIPNIFRYNLVTTGLHGAIILISFYR